MKTNKKLLCIFLVIVMMIPIMQFSVSATALTVEPTVKTEYNGHVYGIYTQKLSWDEAATYCESQGGHLATITSQGENDAITSMLYGTNTAYWIGAESYNDVWTWITDEPWSYTHWGKGEPADFSEPRLVARINCETSGFVEIFHGLEFYYGDWDAVRHLDANKHDIPMGGFICEWEQAPDGRIYPSGYDFSTDRYDFYNINEKIALEYYTGLYGTEKGTELYNYRGEKAKHGHCFGMATSTAATLINAPYVTDYISWIGLPYTNLSSVNKGTMNIDMDISAKDYIKYCHIYQDSAFVCIQRNSANHKGIQNVYNAVKHAVLSNTDCTLIVIDLLGGLGGHTVYAAGIDGNDILVNDSNAPGSIQRIKINGNNWSYSAAGLNWNSSVDATIGYVENCIEPYLRLTMGIDVEGGNVPKNNSNSYSYTEESEINGTYSYTSTVIEPIDTDKLLVVSENDNFSFDESESMYKLNSTDGTAEENANGLYWLDENNTINAVNTSDTTATIKLVGNELKITAEMPADSSTEMTIDENEKNEASFRLKEEENISFTFTTLDENNEFVNIVITGTADTTEITATQTDLGLSVSGISNGTVSLSQNDETVSSQQITNADGEIEITYDKNGKNDTMIVDYQQPHTHSDENKDGICDTCGEDFTKDCSCMCHSNSFVQFIHKVLCFFYKLFGMNNYRYCDCGKAHW